MKALVPAALAASLLAGPATAHATSEWHLMSATGACGFRVVDDNTQGARLGGPNNWWGIVYLAAVRLNGSDLPPDITMSCELRINGTSAGTVLGPTTGSGVVYDALPFVFWSQLGKVVSLCDHITVWGETTVTCTDAAVTQVEPQTVHDATDPTVATVNDAVDDAVVLLNPTLCPGIATFVAPTVDGIGHPELVYVDPATGDVFVGGTTSLQRVWDCPPYGA